MITESKITEIFCIADDFCKEFEVEMAKNALQSSSDAPKRRRKRMMSDAEVMTILGQRIFPVGGEDVKSIVLPV